MPSAKMFFILFALCAIVSSIVSEVTVDNPPPEQIADDQEWTMVPDVSGNMRMVNTFSAMHDPVPFFNAEIGVIFELYTPENPLEAQYLTVGDLPALLASNFNPGRRTRIGVHGWNTDGSLTGRFQEAYFETPRVAQQVNFISVNWQAGSNTLSYPTARRRVDVVGKQLAKLIDFLAHYGELDTESVLLFGHSLGAHVVGVAGKHVTCGLLPTIIGLDPANPLFAMNKPKERIAIGDARSVEIIHTAAGTLGFSAPLGDASFYPNGGRSQPGCGLDMTNACSHKRSAELYAESINTSTGFYSLNCESYEKLKRGKCNEVGDVLRMGGDLGNMGAASGVYYLETNKGAPFAQGHPHRNSLSR